MKVFPYTPDYKKKWNDFLLTAKNATFLFNRDYIEYHANRFRDHSLILVNDNNMIEVLFPANINDNNEVVSHEGLTYGGLVVNRHEKLINVISYFKEMLWFLNDAGIGTVIYKEMPSIYNDVPSGEMPYIFSLLQAKLTSCFACSVIKKSNEFPYQKRRKRAIQNAGALGVEIKADNNFGVFWKTILEPNLWSRHKVKPVHSLEEIQLLHERFPGCIRQFNAYYKGRIMAGATIYEMRDLAKVQYTSGSEEGKRTGSLDLLFHVLINDIYRDKEYFDFGNSNEENGMVLNQGLLEWKEGFGARTYSQKAYAIDTSHYNFLEEVIYYKKEIA
jgi:hypothetical protein